LVASHYIYGMLRIQFPEPSFRLRPGPQGQQQVWDPCRRRWVLLTPEEWVRQHWLLWLMQVAQVPAGLIAVEKQLPVGGRWRRFDIVVYTRQGKPWLLAECKAMEVPLSEAVLQQALAYRSSLPAGLLLISNGRQHLAWQLAGGQAWPLQQLPVYGEGG
jgi:hypothetical protein